jgi:predicted secreted hydrolase
MRSRAAVFALMLLISGQGDRGFQIALPGYKYEFPRDYFDHPEYQTEWWYYTGNVRTKDGRRFGFELTFFREGVSRDPEKNGAWDVRDLYLAHLALSDLDGGKFYHAERTNRAGPGIAGASEKEAKIWNGNWSAEFRNGGQELRAISETFSIELRLRAEKPPVIHGVNAVSQKGAGAGRASHYISLTRLDAAGKIALRGREFEVTGLAWMDHEFFTHQLEPNQTGWDWMSIQLEDNTELMLFRIRRADGTIDPFSAGTYVDAEGKAMHLGNTDFLMEPDGRVWRSLETEAKYPIQWRVEVLKLKIALEATTRLESQELAGKGGYTPNYWEGAIELKGKREREPIEGVGYLEMTGYDRAMGTRRKQAGGAF